MSGAGWRIEVQDEAVQAAFGRVIAAGLDLEPLFDRIGASLVVSTQHRFETETDPQGRKWKPLAKSTLRRKKGDTRILRWRNRLYSSFTHNATADYLEVGSNVIYAGVHQGGATIEHFARSQRATFVRSKSGRMRFASKRSKAKSRVVRPITIGAHAVAIPARPYLGIDDADRAMIVETTEAYIAEAAGGTA